MISDFSIPQVWLERGLSVCLLFGLSFVVQASPENELSKIISEIPELRETFEGAKVQRISALRAEASANIETKRHAVVLFKTSAPSPRLGQMFCHAALLRLERRAWEAEFLSFSEGDTHVAHRLVEMLAPVTQMRRVEDWALPAMNGWQSTICVVSLSDIISPELPSPTLEQLRLAQYEVGKQLYASGKGLEALERFKGLRIDPVLYPDAVLYLTILLHSDHPDIAAELRRSVVNITRAKDIDAVSAYAQAMREAGLIIEAEQAENRCLELGQGCN